MAQKLSEKIINEAISQYPTSEQVQSVIRLCNRGQLQEALYESTQLLGEFPYSATLHNLAGASNVGLMQFDAAIENYRYAIKINPGYAEAYFNMAIAQNDRAFFHSKKKPMIFMSNDYAA